jgi:hypothetical protein
MNGLIDDWIRIPEYDCACPCSEIGKLATAKIPNARSFAARKIGWPGCRIIKLRPFGS